MGQQQYDTMLAAMRDRWLATDIETIAAERAFLATGDARDIRTCRLMAFRTIRRAQRSVARRANDLIAALSTNEGGR